MGVESEKDDLDGLVIQEGMDLGNLRRRKTRNLEKRNAK